jgi:hypothetical protein
MSAPTPGALSPGQIIHGRYEIVRCLNAGGMGAVYECIHLETRKHRALKVILPQVLAHAGVRDRFELEVPGTAEIDSEQVVETFGAGVNEATGAPFLVARDSADVVEIEILDLLVGAHRRQLTRASRGVRRTPFRVQPRELRHAERAGRLRPRLRMPASRLLGRLPKGRHRLSHAAHPRK